MAQFKNIYKVELNKGTAPVIPLRQIYYGDVEANRIGAIVLLNGEEVTLSGSCSGTAILADGSTVAITGTVDGSQAYVELPAACYSVEGQIEVYVKLTASGVTTTLIAAVGTVRLTETDTVIDPGTIIPSVAALIEDIDEAEEALADAIATIPADYSALLASIAPTFSSSTAYTAGSYVWYSGTLYRFTADHAAGAWTGSDAAAAVIGADLASLKSALSIVEERTPPINQWDEVWEIGGIVGTTGANGTSTNQIRSKNYIPVKPNTTYYFKIGTIVGTGSVFQYGSDNSYLGISTLLNNVGGSTFTTDADTHYIRITGGTSYGTTYNNDISINYPSTYTGYYPYTKSKIQYDFDNYAPLDHISAGTILRGKLADSYQNSIKRLLDTGDDLNSYTKPDVLYATANCSHTPDDSHSWYVHVLYIPWQNGARYTTIQIAYRQDATNIVHTRVYDSNSNSWGSWVSNEITAVSRTMLANTYMNTSLNLYSGDVNSKLVPDVFYSAAGNTHNPNGTENFIFVVLYAPWQNNARQTITQIATAISASGNVYYRTYQSYNTTWSDWAGLNQKSVLSDKKIVFLGDSTYAIAGNDGSKIPGWVKTMTAADTYNCAFGGTRLSDSRTDSSDFQYFDFPNLCDAIVAEDFTAQENHIPSSEATAYTANLNRLKAIDFSEVDIVCIEYGTNDFMADVSLGVGNGNKTTVYGALVYGIDKLLTAYPNLTIFVDGIRYRAWLSSGSFVDDAFTHENGLNLKMEDYAEAIEKASYSVGIPYSDNLHGYGWNKYNRGTYFPSNDNTHFNSTGAKFAAKILVEKLSGLGGVY